MKLLVCTAVALALLSGCSNVNVSTSITIFEQRTITVTEVQPPKHFRVMYKINETGETGQLYSKHCSTWPNVKVGNQYTLDVGHTTKYRTDGSVKESYLQMPSACDLSKSIAN